MAPSWLRVLPFVLAAITPGCGGPLATGDASADSGSEASIDETNPDVATEDTAVDDESIVDAADDVPSGDAGLVGSRPYNHRIPSSYNPANPTPLVVLLHGYGASGAGQDLYFGLGTLSARRGFLYAYPDGTIDASGSRFWNATDACCNFGHLPIDDVGYITAIIDDMSAHYNVDPHRIYLIGHSNGAFMSHRMACELSNRVAAIVSLAGAVWSDMSRCTPTAPVSILDVHGDADTVIAYNGGALTGVSYPSEHDTLNGWAMRNGCTGTIADTGMTLDIDTLIPGSETTISAFATCPSAAVELWTIHGGSHIPNLSTLWAGQIYDWLTAHPKP